MKMNTKTDSIHNLSFLALVFICIAILVSLFEQK